MYGDTQDVDQQITTKYIFIKRLRPFIFLFGQVYHYYIRCIFSLRIIKKRG